MINSPWLVKWNLILHKFTKFTEIETVLMF